MNRIFLIGFMGAGKTTIGSLIAEILNYNFIDIDYLIEEKVGKSITNIFSEEGQEQFRKYEQKILKDIVKQENIVVATGGGTPCYNNNMDLIKKSGISVYLKQPALMLYYRLRETQDYRPLIADINLPDLMPTINNTLRERKPFYKQADITIQYNSSPIYEVADKIITELYKLGLRNAPPTTSSNDE